MSDLLFTARKWRATAGRVGFTGFVETGMTGIYVAVGLCCLLLETLQWVS